MEKKLYRSRAKRMISGVCGGLAEFFSVDETLVRLGFALITAVTGFVPGVILYFVAALIIPESPDMA